MSYRPKYINSNGTLTDIPLEAETSVKLKNSRTIGLSGVTATAQFFDGTKSITIPVTSVPSALLTGKASVDTTGEASSAKDYNAAEGSIQAKFNEIDRDFGKIKIESTYYAVRKTTSTTDNGSPGFITLVVG